MGIGCEAAFPIVMGNPDAADDATADAKNNKDGSVDDGAPLDAVAEDNYVAPPGPDGGLWCGVQDGGAEAGGYCKGTCCIKIGNGYSFTCQSLGNPCTGDNFALSCTRMSDCNNGDLCCYTEQGALEAGTYRVESHCGQCNQQDSMCLYQGMDDCPGQTSCHPWFSAYGQCY